MEIHFKLTNIKLHINSIEELICWKYVKAQLKNNILCILYGNILNFVHIFGKKIYKWNIQISFWSVFFIFAIL